MNANALVKALSVLAPRVNEIVRERRGMTAGTALRLARYFDTTPQSGELADRLRPGEIAAGSRIKREVNDARDGLTARGLTGT